MFSTPSVKFDPHYLEHLNIGGLIAYIIMFYEYVNLETE